MKKFTFLLVIFFSVSAFAMPNSKAKQFKRQDSQHIKEIFEAWDENKGSFLYESVAAIVMGEKQPEQPKGLKKTSFELLQSMDDSRIDRLNRAAQQELENEKANTRGKRASYYWQEWTTFVNSSRCATSTASSNGDPHITTFDGERYDFQNAGDYLLTGSNNNSFEIQTQMKRPKNSTTISQNHAVAMNVNQDKVEFRPSTEAKNGVAIFINGEEMLVENADYTLSQGGFIQHKSRNQYLVKWNTGEQAIVKTRGTSKNKMFDVFVSVPECRSDYYYGMLGDNNGNKENDLLARNPKEEDRQIVSSVFTSAELFGADRTSPEVINRQQSKGRYISHTFGDRFMLRAETSLFSEKMVDIPDEIRYPSEHLTLAQLSDEQVEEGLRKAKEAGVEEAELYAAVYDYGHIGLEPEPFQRETSSNQNVVTPSSEHESQGNRVTEPENNNSGNSNTNTNSNMKTFPGVIIGSGNNQSPNRRPVYTRPNNRTNSPTEVKTPSRSSSSSSTPSNRSSSPTRTPTSGSGRGGR